MVNFGDYNFNPFTSLKRNISIPYVWNVFWNQLFLNVGYLVCLWTHRNTEGVYVHLLRREKCKMGLMHIFHKTSIDTPNYLLVSYVSQARSEYRRCTSKICLILHHFTQCLYNKSNIMYSQMPIIFTFLFLLDKSVKNPQELTLPSSSLSLLKLRKCISNSLDMVWMTDFLSLASEVSLFWTFENSSCSLKIKREKIINIYIHLKLFVLSFIQVFVNNTMWSTLMMGSSWFVFLVTFLV